MLSIHPFCTVAQPTFKMGLRHAIAVQVQMPSACYSTRLHVKWPLSNLLSVATTGYHKVLITSTSFSSLFPPCVSPAVLGGGLSGEGVHFSRPLQSTEALFCGECRALPWRRSKCFIGFLHIGFPLGLQRLVDGQKCFFLFL